MAQVTEIGRDVGAQFGGHLECSRCGATQPLGAERAGRYMAAGWPMCCGETMRWWTQRELTARAALAAGEVGNG